MSSLPGTLNVRIKFCHSIGMRDLVVGSEPTQQAMLSEGSDPANPPNQNIRTKFILKNIQRTQLTQLQSCLELMMGNSQHSGYVHLFSQPRRRRVCIGVMYHSTRGTCTCFLNPVDAEFVYV